MSKRARLLSEIYDMSTNPQEVIIFTSAFKAKGTFLRDDSQRKEGVITLQDAVVCNHFYDCTCGDSVCNHYVTSCTAASFIKVIVCHWPPYP